MPESREVEARIYILDMTDETLSAKMDIRTSMNSNWKQLAAQIQNWIAFVGQRREFETAVCQAFHGILGANHHRCSCKYLAIGKLDAERSATHGGAPHGFASARLLIKLILLQEAVWDFIWLGGSWSGDWIAGPPATPMPTSSHTLLSYCLLLCCACYSGDHAHYVLTPEQDLITGVLTSLLQA